MKKFITLIIAIAMIATLATGCGVDTPAEDVFNKYDKDTTITETEKDSADKSDDKDDDKSDSDKKDESDKKDDNKSEADKKDDDKVADNKPADNADKNNGSKTSGSGSTNSNTGSKPSGGNSNSGNTGTKPSGGSNNNNNTGSKPSGGNTNQSKPVEPQKPSHSHSYAVVSQTGATCTAAGVTTYKCSCGNSYTEQNGGALGHAWQTQYNEWDEVVHHPGTVVTKLVCSHGNVFSNTNEHTLHCDALMEQGLDGCGVSSYTEEVGGSDETVHHKDPCGQKCTRCGANG